MTRPSAPFQGFRPAGRRFAWRAALGTAAVLAATMAAAAAPESGTAVPSTRPAGVDLRVFLPPDDAVAGWKRSEEPRVFDGKTLFSHIDGGAEEFLAHGFRSLAVVGYRHDSLEVVAEVYNLGMQRGATAILDARGSRDESGPVADAARPDSSGRTPPAVGESCVLDPLQVLFRRSGFFVSVTGFEPRPEVTAVLLALADSIDARIKARITVGR